MPSLGKDLATLRKKRDLSIEDVQQTSRIPGEIHMSIEDDSIFDEINTNTTYIRNYVRSYARAIGVEEEHIVRALNQVQRGTYDGGLIVEEAPKPPENASDTEKEEPPEKESKPEKPEPKPKTKRKSSKDIKPVKSERPSDWDWVRVGNRAKTRRSKPSRGKVLLIILLVLAVLAAGVAVYYYYYYEADQNTTKSEPVEQPTMPSDSLRESLISSNNASQRTVTSSQPENGSLPDTLSLTIYAANGNLEPVRVYTDILGKRNPYWVARDDSIQFDFVNIIRIRAVNQYDRLQLQFNGHTIPNFYQQYYKEDLESIELNRSTFKDHPEWLQPAQ